MAASSSKAKRGNTPLTEEELFEILNNLSDADDLSDSEDEQYIPPNNQLQDDDDNDSEDSTVEEEAAAAGPLKKKAKKQATWRKKEFQPSDTTWTGGTDQEPLETLKSPYEYFKGYIPNHIFEQFAEHTNHYSLKKRGVELGTNSNEIEVLFGLHIKMGSLKYPQLRLYWSAESGTRLPMIADHMSYNRFSTLRTNLHVVDIDNPVDGDRLWKIRPLAEAVQEKCKSLPKSEYYCVDEQMIPFKGQLNIKQYIKGKPTPWGVKIFVLCASNGLMADFLIYQGKTTAFQPEFQHFGLGTQVVLQLCSSLPRNKNVKLAFDNFFTSLPLLRELKAIGILSVGTIRSNRLESCNMQSDKLLMKEERGSRDYRVDTSSNICAVKWVDNKVVTLVSTFCGQNCPSTVRRWCKKTKEHKQVPIPEIVNVYNSKMGGVDLLDMLLSLYRIHIRSKKWTLRVIFHFVDLACCNGWLEYRHHAKELGVPKPDILNLFQFREAVAYDLMFSGKQHVRRAVHGSSERKKAVVRPKPQSQSEARYDGIGHFPKYSQEKNSLHCKYEPCKKKTKVMCIKCKVHVCFTSDHNCFLNYHMK